jgi:hypothetical protein
VAKWGIQLRRMLDKLTPGDVVTVTRLDRLARSTRERLSTLAATAEIDPDAEGRSLPAACAGGCSI